MLKLNNYYIAINIKDNYVDNTVVKVRHSVGGS